MTDAPAPTHAEIEALVGLLQRPYGNLTGSERQDVAAALTALQAENGILRTEKHADAEAIGALQAERDAAVARAEAAEKDNSAATCVGCGKPATGMCWTDCGMSLCGAPICETCRHIDETHGWSHGPRAIAGGNDE